VKEVRYMSSSQEKSKDVVRFEQCLEIKKKLSERLTSAKSLLAYKKEELTSIKRECAEEFGEDSPEMLAELYRKRVQANLTATRDWIKSLSFIEDKIVFVEGVLGIESPQKSANSLFDEKDVEGSYARATNLANSFSKRLARIESSANYAKKQLDEMRDYCRERFGEHSSEPLAALYHERVEENNKRIEVFEKDLNQLKGSVERVEKAVASFVGR